MKLYSVVVSSDFKNFRTFEFDHIPNWVYDYPYQQIVCNRAISASELTAALLENQNQ